MFKFIVWTISTILFLIVASIPILAGWGIWYLVEPTTEFGRLAVLGMLFIAGFPTALLFWVGIGGIWIAWTITIVETKL